jgi:beta-lactamase class A
MLMNNVPHGNNPGARRPNHSATQYLNTPPVAAPNATAREFHVAVTAWISSLLIMPKPLIALWFAAALVSSAQTVAQLYAEKTLANIAAVDRTLDGVLTVAAIDLTTGETLEYHARTESATASLIKVPLLVQLMRAKREGAFGMVDKLTLQSADAVGGSGHLQEELAKGPVTLTVHDLIVKMIVDSDNTATNRLIALAGMEKVNATMQSLGLAHTRIQRVMMDSAAARNDRENASTPADIARLLALIWRDEAAAPEDCREILSIMKRVNGAFRATITDDVEVASKTGEIGGVYTEGGIVMLKNRPFAFAVMTSLLPDAVNPIPTVAAILYRHFERLGRGNLYGNEVH